MLCLSARRVHARYMLVTDLHMFARGMFGRFTSWVESILPMLSSAVEQVVFPAPACALCEVVECLSDRVLPVLSSAVEQARPSFRVPPTRPGHSSVSVTRSRGYACVPVSNILLY